MPEDRRTPNADDQVKLLTRILALFIIPFLLAAFGILYLRPLDTKALFAWEITPPLTATLLASAYLGGAYYFVRVVFERRWHRVHIGLLPVVAFASLLGVATLLHWDRFTPGHISFITWAALYFTTPFLVLAVWWHNRRSDPRTPGVQDVTVPTQARIVLASFGGLALAGAAALFARPSLFLEVWPWPVTPLTTRVIAAVFVLGGAFLWTTVEARWSALRLMLETQVIMFSLMLVAGLRAAQDFRSSTAAAAWLAVLGATMMMVIGFYIWMEAHSRRAGRTLSPIPPGAQRPAH